MNEKELVEAMNDMKAEQAVSKEVGECPFCGSPVDDAGKCSNPDCPTNGDGDDDGGGLELSPRCGYSSGGGTPADHDGATGVEDGDDAFEKAAETEEGPRHDYRHDAMLADDDEEEEEKKKRERLRREAERRRSFTMPEPFGVVETGKQDDGYGLGL